jgi:hypothetical protein
MFNWFKRNDVDFTFAEICEGAVYPHYPPILAKDLKPLKKFQEEKYQEYKFPGCPGMHDYSRMGYILPAWTNFHIKANKAGTVGFVGSDPGDRSKRSTPAKPPQPMAKEITDGLYEIKDGVKHEILNFPGAWKIFGRRKDVSLLLMPAFYHSTFLDDLYVYPGVVDYNGFSTINFICSPKRACTVEIKAGDPVLHLIPILNTKDIVADYGNATQLENDYGKLLKWYHEKNFYRKFYMIRKKYKLSLRKE